MVKFSGIQRHIKVLSIMKVTIIIPVYNEVNTIEEILRRVEAENIATEILIVDDGSTDGTREILDSLDEGAHLRIFFHEHNRGKGAGLPD